MFNGKKSVVSNLETIVRIGAALLLIFLIVLPLWNKAHAALTSQQYQRSFERFVDDINKMNLGKDTFTISLKEKSAIIGFSKNSERYECFNCYIGVQNRPSVIVNKPKNEYCDNKACICLCGEAFNLLESSLDGKSMKLGQCSSLLKCKTVERLDIIDKVVIKTYPGINLGIATLGGGGQEYWKNGFLFANGISGANGLKMHSDNLNVLNVEKRLNLIGVCNADMLGFNKNTLKFDSCIITEYDEAKKLEASNMQEAIRVYKEFIDKYKNGREVEESLFIIGKFYFNSNNYKESSEVLCRLTKEFPTSSYRDEASKILVEISKKIPGQMCASQ